MQPEDEIAKKAWEKKVEAIFPFPAKLFANSVIFSG
jgi:hypothetical protein